MRSFLLNRTKKDLRAAIRIETAPCGQKKEGFYHHHLHQHQQRFFSSEKIINGDDSTSTSKSTATSSPIVHKSKSKLNYFRGWAYQQVYLNRRISYKRRQGQTHRSGSSNPPSTCTLSDSKSDSSDRDRILFFEHESVYTLGRGADENHLTFLNEENRHLLSRRSNKSAAGERGEDQQRQQNSSRLYVDKFKHNQSSHYASIEEEVNSMDEPQPILSPNGAPIYRIERGGEVTYHGPGQLVCYPLLDLTQKPPYKQDLHWYLHSIEEVIIQTLSEYGIQGKRDDINTGVWVDSYDNGSGNSSGNDSGNDSVANNNSDGTPTANKIAAVGVSSSRWITTHGFALNIDPDLSYFDTSLIIPCGIEGRGVTSIANVLKEQHGDKKHDDGHSNKNTQIPSIDDVTNVVIDKFELVFDVKVEREGSLLS